MSELVEKDMKRLWKNILPQMPSILLKNIPGGVNIFLLNINILKDDDIVKNSHIIPVNENHLGHSDILTPDMMDISKDVLIVHCDCNNKGGGVALIVNKNLNPKQIRIHRILRIVAVKISEPIHMIVVSVYRPQTTPIDVFMNHMLQIIVQFQHIPTCIVEAFNENVSITSNTHCCAMFRSEAFKQMVSKPTHDSGTIIDHVYVSQTINTMQTDVTDCYSSDHDFILFAITVLLTYVAFFVKQQYTCDEYHILQSNHREILCKMNNYSNM